MIPITNRTMELSDCRKDWFFDEKYNCWCLEDILYTGRATTPKFQRLSIFVPKPYMEENGRIVPDGEMNGYMAQNVPVIFENNSAGYMQMPHVWLEGPRCYAHQYLEHGFVYVTCGNRGSESRDSEGRLCGKSPANLVDLKTAIRFLRHNADSIPGDLDRIISVGWSAGGAMSTLLGVTGNNESFLPYLEENGAFMEERDDVYACQIYCPIIDLEHADLAYEWMFSADPENEPSPVGPAAFMTPFQAALSEKLKEKYIAYFNGLGLEDPEDHSPIRIGKDGRSGSGYDYLMKKLNESATDWLTRLSVGELPKNYGVKDYLAGNYEYEIMAPIEKDKETLVPPTVMVKAKEKSSWLFWDGEHAVIRDLDSYVLKHRRRMKPCPSFDTLEKNSGENCVFGSPEKHYMHFNAEIAEVIEQLKEQFPEEWERYYGSYAEEIGDEALKRRIWLINPLNFIGTEEKSDVASFYRIRVGASDADTSLSVSMTLALKLAALGKLVDYALVWEQPHSEADYPGEVCRWIDSLCR